MGVVSKFVANIVTKKGGSPVFDDPKEDFGLDYENVTFKAKDGVLLSGWLVNPGQKKVIIQTHFGIQCSRSGYTPKGKGLMKSWNENIRFLKHAKSLADQGYSILMYDMRNHGKSADGTSEWITGGVEEYKDVIAAVDYISNHSDYKNASIGLLSICMGCNATTYAYGIESGLQEFENIKAMVAIQPLGFDDFLDGIGMPNSLIERANYVSLRRGGAD
ncbi:MAG: alpha/beta hydrolase, partial [Cyclobacteriaceae bacterium]